MPRPVGSAPVRDDLEEVFRREYRFVVGVVARVLGSQEHAEDVAQEVLLSFGHSSVATDDARRWLSVAAAHAALNHLRSQRRREAREDRSAARDDRVEPDVAEAVVTGEERRRVRAALARLPRAQAVALILRHSGFAYAEVAAALGIAPGSVGTTIRRAEFALSKELCNASSR